MSKPTPSSLPWFPYQHASHWIPTACFKNALMGQESKPAGAKARDFGCPQQHSSTPERLKRALGEARFQGEPGAPASDNSGHGENALLHHGLSGRRRGPSTPQGSSLRELPAALRMTKVRFDQDDNSLGLTGNHHKFGVQGSLGLVSERERMGSRWSSVRRSRSVTA